jgi:hypothetical protein
MLAVLLAAVAAARARGQAQFHGPVLTNDPAARREIVARRNELACRTDNSTLRATIWTDARGDRSYAHKRDNRNVSPCFLTYGDNMAALPVQHVYTQ